MERIEYDPEIDPSIREEREAAEREMELSARIRLEIKRYVEENDLVPRDKADKAAPPGVTEDTQNDIEDKNGSEKRETDSAGENDKKREKEEKKQIKKARKVERAKGRRKAIGSMFTGSILSSERMRTMWPYLLVFALLLVGYIAHTFQLQKLNLERQALEREIRELGVDALDRNAQRVRGTSRSAIVERLNEKGIPLEEFPHPVKTIER